jgi:hypothetical protein
MSRDSEVRPRVRGDVDPADLRARRARTKRVLPDCVDHGVEHSPGASEVLLRVVDDLVRAEGAHEVEVRRATHARDVGAKMLRDLDGRGPE